MDIALTKMSSKGQVVIPANMRKNIHEGDKLLIIKNKDQIIMKRAKDLDENLKHDLEFAKRTEEALRRIEGGKGIKMNFEILFFLIFAEKIFISSLIFYNKLLFFIINFNI